MDDWAACDAEAVVTALSVRYRFSRANAVADDANGGGFVARLKGSPELRMIAWK